MVIRDNKGRFVNGHGRLRSDESYVKSRKVGMTGKHHSEQTRDVIRQKLKGKKYPGQFVKGQKQMNTGRTHFKVGQNAGSKHRNWKGGLTPLRMSIRKSFKYRQWVSDVFTRDDFTCQECGRRGCVLNVHHVKAFFKICEENDIRTIEQALACEELWNINNGQTLCEDCHNKTKNERWTTLS